jgi:hypothetical protein
MARSSPPRTAPQSRASTVASVRALKPRRFAHKLLLALSIWLGLTLTGLSIGMAGYMVFEGMSLTDAYVNAAMILSGMGPIGELKTTGGKIFAGSYALFSGLIIVIATGFLLAPIFHRVLHRFHVERGSENDD